MKSVNKNLLSVAVCTKRIGLAVFGGKELLYFAVKTLKLPRTVSRTKIQASEIFREAAAQFTPDLIVLKLLGKQQLKSKSLRSVVRIVRQNAKTSGIPLRELSFEEIKQEICAGKKANKASTFSALSKIYPELRRLTKFQNPPQAEYYNSLLSAAAIGFYFQNRNRKNPHA